MRKPMETSSHLLPLMCSFCWDKKHNESHLFYIKFVLHSGQKQDHKWYSMLLCLNTSLEKD